MDEQKREALADAAGALAYAANRLANAPINTSRRYNRSARLRSRLAPEQLADGSRTRLAPRKTAWEQRRRLNREALAAEVREALVESSRRPSP